MRHARSIKLVEDLSPLRDERWAAPSSLRAPSGGRRVATGGKHARRVARAGDVVDIFTDGACKGNPGPGGWGALLRHGDREKELFGGENPTTNNRMELTAVIEALQSLKRRCHVIVHTDSQYVQLGITEWVRDWIRRDWKTAAKKPVKNADLWQRLVEVVAKHEIEWRWVRGHAGNVGNERADELANRGAELVSASHESTQIRRA